MNIWYWVALIIAIVAVVFLLGCLVIAGIGLKKVADRLLMTVNRLQEEQLNPLQKQANTLNATINTIKMDVDYKKENVQSVIQSVKGIGQNLTTMNDSTRQQASALVKHVQNDPQRQAQTEEWTNKAMGILNRNA